MFTLEQITTKDGLIHQGILAEPETPNGKVLVFVHGLTDTFYGNTARINTFARQCLGAQMAFASFNTRGHDMVTEIKKVDATNSKGYTYAMGGAGYEEFSECIYDIDAVIDFLVSKKYQEMYLIGHSSGANKACYYAAVNDRKELAGIILACPMSDRQGRTDNPELTANTLEAMQTKIREETGNELITDLTYFPITPKRYVSLLAPHSLEDQFDYGDEKPEMMYYSRIKKPLCVIFAGNDENADRPITDIKAVFDQATTSSTYQSVIIADVLHNLSGKEDEVSKRIVEWVNNILR
jgi:hypothetical protein